MLHGNGLWELAEHPLLEGLQPLVVMASAHVFFVLPQTREPALCLASSPHLRRVSIATNVTSMSPVSGMGHTALSPCAGGSNELEGRGNRKRETSLRCGSLEAGHRLWEAWRREGTLPRKGYEVAGGILEKAVPEESPERPFWVISEGGAGKGSLCGHSDNQGNNSPDGQEKVQWKEGRYVWSPSGRVRKMPTAMCQGVMGRGATSLNIAQCPVRIQ